MNYSGVKTVSMTYSCQWNYQLCSNILKLHSRPTNFELLFIFEEEEYKIGY